MDTDQRVARLEEAFRLLRGLVIPGSYPDPQSQRILDRIDALIAEMGP